MELQRQAKKHKLEDGTMFQVFSATNDKTKRKLYKERAYSRRDIYLDFRQKDGSKLRIFKNRKKSQ